MSPNIVERIVSQIIQKNGDYVGLKRKEGDRISNSLHKKEIRKLMYVKRNHIRRPYIYLCCINRGNGGICLAQKTDHMKKIPPKVLI